MQSGSTPLDKPDGRVRRGERNRESILDALFELIRAGRLLPTADEVARRAGVGTRTVFRHFEDMERLHAEMSARLRAELAPLLAERPPQGDTAERVAWLVDRRARLYETMAPFRRSADIQRWRSKFLQQEHHDMNRAFRSDLRAALAPELEGAPAFLLDALDLATSFEAWERLRGTQRLGVERAERVLGESIRALLASASMDAARHGGSR